MKCNWSLWDKFQYRYQIEQKNCQKTPNKTDTSEVCKRFAVRRKTCIHVDIQITNSNAKFQYTDSRQ